jgi:hypothetical protein
VTVFRRRTDVDNVHANARSLEHRAMEVPFPLSSWESFYVIVGSSGAALTGLQFVVVTLVADSAMNTSTGEIDAFATPTVVHFCVVLFIAAALSAPWPSMFGPDLLLAGCGLYGIGYTATVVRRARATPYRPVAEDWIWHVLLPAIAYGSLIASAAILSRHMEVSLFMAAGVSVLLLFIGIHNAWDTVTYVATMSRTRENQAEGQGAQLPPPVPPTEPS